MNHNGVDEYLAYIVSLVLIVCDLYGCDCM